VSVIGLCHRPVPIAHTVGQSADHVTPIISQSSVTITDADRCDQSCMSGWRQ